jgi:hypothetical protein
MGVISEKATLTVAAKACQADLRDAFVVFEKRGEAAPWRFRHIQRGERLKASVARGIGGNFLLSRESLNVE